MILKDRDIVDKSKLHNGDSSLLLEDMVMPEIHLELVGFTIFLAGHL